MMTEFICSTIECNNKIQYYNVNEDSYYCEECAYSYFNENEFEKVGSINIIKQVMKLNQNLLYKVQNYAKEEKLAIKWRTELEQFKIFYDELAKANKDLESSLKARRLNNLQFIQTRSTNLKSKIIESEAYRKYLLHKDISEHRQILRNQNNILPIVQIVKGLTDQRYEEEKVTIAETLHKWVNVFDRNSNLILEFENTKRKYEDEITKIRRQIEEDKEKYEKEEKLWLEQRYEIENELDKTKSQLEILEASNSISYDVFQTLYRKYIGNMITLCSSSNITFNLSEDKWKSFMKIVSKLKLPQINNCYINSVPFDSEEVRSFISNSFSTLNNFCFDTDWKTELLASNYLESLKIAASKVKNQFAVDKTKFSSYEFCELVSAAKGVKELHFQYDKILLDESADFGDMEGSNIECLGFYCSGGSNYSNWKDHPIRFENIIAGIRKSKGLKGSLKRLYIHSCEITNDKAQEVLNKYELHEVMLEGV